MIVEKLVKEELGYCCVTRFLIDNRKHSARKIADALGVSHRTIEYWRDKFYRKKLGPCSSNCRSPRRPPELKTTASGRVYFARSASR